MAFLDNFKKVMGIGEEEEPTETEIESAMKELKDEDVQPRKSLFSGVKTLEEPVKEQPAQTTYKPFIKDEAQKKQTLASFTATSANTLVVIEPKGFEECPKLVDNLKGRRPVIINLEKVETETAKKIFDFLSGATYALSGNVHKVSNNIYIFAPQSVDIASNEERSFDVTQAKNWKDRL